MRQNHKRNFLKAALITGLGAIALSLVIFINLTNATSIGADRISTSGSLSVTGISTFSGQNQWDTGTAVTGSTYSVGRDADATNQLHFNVPTGASMEWSVNDTQAVKLASNGTVEIGNNFPTGVTSSNPNVTLYVSQTATPASGIIIGSYVDQYTNPSANDTTLVGSVSGARSATSNSRNIYQIAGTQSIGRHQGSGTVTDVVGMVGDAVTADTGNISNAYGSWHRTFLQGSGNITNSIGAFFASPFDTGAGSITNAYGIWIDPITSGTTLNYPLYYNNGVNGFYITGAGNVGIGDSTPSYKLEVAGTASVTGDFSVESTGYMQFKKSGAGAPNAGDCDADGERGRLYIDTTANSLYICNGASRAWDSITLTN